MDEEIDQFIGIEEARRKHALELACEGYRHSGMACNTDEIVKQAAAFEAYLRGEAAPEKETQN